jgi:hypothetical protein
LDREPRLGDLVVASVVSVNAHDSLENPHGRRVRLYPGDVVVGVTGMPLASTRVICRRGPWRTC